VSATASSGLTVTLASLTITVCTISGSTVTIKATGTCTLQGSQAGTTNYNAAPNVSKSFTIGKANRRFSFGALANKTYGAASFHRECDRIIGVGRDVFVAVDHRVHSQRQHGHDQGRRPLHDPGGAGRKRELQRGPQT
jgi:hypothetical protein